MTDRQAFSDEELTSYLDGEADAALTEAIAAARRLNPVVDARLAELDLDRGAVKAAFDALLEEVPAMPPELTARREVAVKTGALSLRSIAATAAFCLLVGGLAGAWLTAPREATWRDFAAAYHALYVEQTLSIVNTAPPTVKAELKRVSDALGKEIRLAALSGVDRLAYKRAQVLGFEGQPLIQLAFLSKQGTPVALCIIRAGGEPAQAIKMQEMHAMSAASWTKNGFSYLLVGGADAKLIEQAATDFAARL